MTLGLARITFFILSIIITSAWAVSGSSNDSYMSFRLLFGVIGGSFFGFFLISLDNLFRRFNLKALNTLALGLLFGYFLGQGLALAISSALTMTLAPITPEAMGFVKALAFLSGIYLATVMTVHSSNELQISIPFIKFRSSEDDKKDIILDESMLLDSRAIDIASSGILDHRLIIPNYIIKNLQSICEEGDEISKAKARRSLEIIEKLEELPNLGLRYDTTDLSDIKDQKEKLVKIAKIVNANIITADLNKLESSNYKEVRVININTLSHALKPLTQSGEVMNIKVQRLGKEDSQGVGYLDDGTMVVINGGGDYIGETIKTQVLSVKHSASGRIVFCNALEEEPITILN